VEADELLGEQSGLVVEVLPPESDLGEEDVVRARLRAPLSATLGVSIVKEAYLPARRVDGLDVSMPMEACRLDREVGVFSVELVETDAWHAGPKGGMCKEPCIVVGRFAD